MCILHSIFGVHDIVEIKGHRSIGGIRISLYNVVTLKQAEKVASLLKQFAEST